MRVRSAAAVLAALVAPAPARAAVTDLSAGPAAGATAAAPASAEFDAFFRRHVTVAAGDSVRWQLRGFHTVTFVPPGATAPAFVNVDVTRPLRSPLDAAGRPFWFGGLPTLFLGADTFRRIGGGTFDGRHVTSSGLPPLRGAIRPYTLRFTRPGTYTYVCLSHPGTRNVANGMRGTVTVLPRGRPVPSAAANRAAAAREATAAARRARALARWAGPSGARVEAGHDTTGITLLSFFPRTRRIRVGTTVTFEMSPRSLSFHTVSFGPARYLDARRRQFEPVGTGPGPTPHIRLNPIVFFGTEPTKLGSDPASPTPAYDGRNHGNGLMSLIAMDIDRTPASPNPSAVRVRFTRPGRFAYVCLVHRGMRGTIVVVPKA